MSDAPEIVPVEPAQSGPAPLDGQMDIPEPREAEQPPENATEKAPEKAEEKPAKAKSLDDSLKDAFRKGREAAERKAAKDAEAPKEPAAQEPAAQEPAAQEPAAPKEPAKAPEPKPTAYRDPPARFDDAGKLEWETVPESVRGNIHRVQKELEAGIEKYRTQAAAFDEVRDYADMARQGGTTLRAALDQYVGMENALRQNPIAGLDQIVSNLGLRDNQGNPVTLRALAAQIAGQPMERVSSQQDATIMQLRQQVQQMTQQLGGVQQHFAQQEQQQRVSHASGEWDAFAREHPRAEEWQDEIAEVLLRYPAGDNITIKERLSDAYAIVSARHPEAAHTGTQALAQTQAPEPRQPKPEGRKSISGSPSSDTLIPSSRTAPPPSIDEALARAAKRLRA